MSPGAWFLASLLVAVALLAGVLVTGFRRAVRAHVALVVSFLLALGAAIFFAERLGRTLDLEAAGAITPIHLTLAKATTLGYLLPLATGVLTWRDRKHRRLHRWTALTLVALTLVTVGTGTWMVLASTPR